MHCLHRIIGLFHGTLYLTIIYMSYIFETMSGVKRLNYTILKLQILQGLEPTLHKSNLSAEIYLFAHIPAKKNGRHSRNTYARWDRWFVYLTCIIHLSLAKLPYSLKAPLIPFPHQPPFHPIPLRGGYIFSLKQQV